ncbi:MAG TPA: hypothetical protein VK623_07130 [Flavobacterium sp.]|nr:hypothetical protein [Flavobacterium sp.]
MRKFRPVLEILILSVAAFVLHKVIFYLSGLQAAGDEFHYSLEMTYGFFLLCSLIIILILIKVKENNIDNVGHTFLLLTCLKMGAAYAVLYPILQSAAENAKTEKMNFFIVFAVFLTIETIASIRILNKS